MDGLEAQMWDALVVVDAQLARKWGDIAAQVQHVVLVPSRPGAPATDPFLATPTPIMTWEMIPRLTVRFPMLPRYTAVEVPIAPDVLFTQQNCLVIPWHQPTVRPDCPPMTWDLHRPVQTEVTAGEVTTTRSKSRNPDPTTIMRVTSAFRTFRKRGKMVGVQVQEQVWENRIWRPHHQECAYLEWATTTQQGIMLWCNLIGN